MAEEANDGRSTEFHITIPSDLEGGVYANVLVSWHTAYEFTLDFAASQPPELADPDDPDSQRRVRCRVVTRVRIPVTSSSM
jgi:hypothetical protein